MCHSEVPFIVFSGIFLGAGMVLGFVAGLWMPSGTSKEK